MSRTESLGHWALSNSVLAAIVVVAAGSRLVQAEWIYLGVVSTMTLVAALIADPEMMAERSRPGPGSTHSGDRHTATLLFLATVTIGALDAGRWHWTPAVPHSIQITVLVILGLAMALETWAMAVNPFFSSAIRLQSDRGHHVISRGPYRFVRHPGYFAMLAIMPATAVALGSFIALFSALCYSVLILWRTANEDRFLAERLAGYAAYGKAVRYRLMPGIW
jgi:protein-S-isoprenylcysteine O-methyltransferase Ste14